ncbi:MAG: lipocalin family protein [Bacteroidaceae bacterium]|nr:lipocalin family protein [Bacteroidaceae bacterium]
MKKYFSLLAVLLLTTISCFTFTSCGDDDDTDNGFNYPIETIYGTWEAQEIEVDGKWYNITVFPYTRFAMSITFYSNGRFYGTGYFGTGSGTYKAVDNKIVTYLEGEEYMVYTIISLSENFAELTMSDGGDTMRIRAKKK